jgi:hypothetical protein
MEGVLFTDHLTTLAEVAIALAGFSALVALLGNRARRADRRADAMRLQFMLETSLLVVAFALFPFIPLTLGVSSDLVWRISGGAFLIADATYWMLSYKRGRAARALLAPAERRLRIVMLLLAYTADLLMIVVVLGLTGLAAPGIYFAALYAELVLSGVFFITFAASIFAPPE